MNGVPFPLFRGKQTLPAVPDPAEHAQCVQSRNRQATLASVYGVVLIYQRSLLNFACRHLRVSPAEGWIRGDLLLLERQGRQYALCGGFGVGAPAAGLILEQLIALGAREVITVGTAASVQPDMHPGAIVLCHRALRDEGLSHHYLPPSRYATPSPV